MKTEAEALKDFARRAARKISLEGKVCDVCGSTDALDRHHPDYGKPLEFNILCRVCHGASHRNEPIVIPPPKSYAPSRVARGGRRAGAGRKREDANGVARAPRTFWITPDEYSALKAKLEQLREQAKEAKSRESYD